MAFRAQNATLIISQQRTLLPWLLQQHLDLIVLEFNDPLVVFVSPANEGGNQNMVRLDDELHGKLGRTKEIDQLSFRVT